MKRQRRTMHPSLRTTIVPLSRGAVGFALAVAILMYPFRQGACATPEEVAGKVREADTLLEGGKYESAFALLYRFDTRNEYPPVQTKKVEIAIRYFVRSVDHTRFAFKDVKPGEDIGKLRSGNGNYSLYTFDVPSIFKNLMEKNPEDYTLHRWLGEYYYDAFHHLRGRWALSDEQAAEQFVTPLEEARNHQVFDNGTLIILGEGYLILNKPIKATQVLEEALKSAPADPGANYSMALALLKREESDKALPYARKAMEGFADPENKSRAAALQGVILTNQRDYGGALEMFRRSDELQPGDYTVRRAILDLQVKLELEEELQESSASFLEIAPESPALFQDLMKLYGDNGRLDRLLLFFLSQKERYKENPVVSGNLAFYSGTIYFLNGDYESAKLEFVNARQQFRKAYSYDHQVFNVIKRYLELIEKGKK